MALTARTGEWQVRPRAPASVLDGLDVGSPLLAQLLLNRGIADAATASAFLDGFSTSRDGDPYAMADMAVAVERVAAAIRAEEPIVVYGDYDVDGLSGATLLAVALRAVGAEASVYIPHRERDGYGLNAAVLDGLAERSARLVISVDCGVSAIAEVAAAARAGLDIIVTDHHQVPAEMPEAAAVINPHRPDCAYPFKQLAGAGVALKLAQALVRDRLPPPDADRLELRLLELAALGTVADVMPLVGENRTIVRRGLSAINNEPLPGLAALIRSAGLRAGEIDAEAVAYKLAPRLNAAGRLAEAELAHRLLAAETTSEAELLAAELEALNGQRRVLMLEALTRARGELAALGEPLPPAVVLCGEYPAGLLGLVAARLSEETARPTLVIQRADGICRGSLRGGPGFDAAAALSACSDLLAAHGGHRAAAGLSVLSERVDAFRGRFLTVVESAPSGLAEAAGREADCRLRPTSINFELCELLRRLEPCGIGNPRPLFETRGLHVREARTVGGRHLRLKLSAEGARHEAIMFDAAGAGPLPGRTIDVLHHVRRNCWRDAISVELEVVDWRPAEA